MFDHFLNFGYKYNYTVAFIKVNLLICNFFVAYFNLFLLPNYFSYFAILFNSKNITKMRYQIVWLFGLILSCCQAQESKSIPDNQIESVSLSRTNIHYLPSEEVGVTYKLYISLPYHFDPNSSYPVIFLLDPEYSFAIAKNITDHLSERNDLEDVIVVGIGYQVDNYRLNRTRDYTPSYTLEGGYSRDLQKHSGGATKFLDFMERELFPFIEENYTSIKNKTLVGHSFGGLFTSWTLLHRPNLFDQYIAISPSLWYDNRLIFTRVEELQNTQTGLKERVLFTVGSREINSQRSMVRDLNDFSQKLKEATIEGLQFKTSILDNETHNTIFPRAFSDGLRYVFQLR